MKRPTQTRWNKLGLQEEAEFDSRPPFPAFVCKVHSFISAINRLWVTVPCFKKRLAGPLFEMEGVYPERPHTCLRSPSPLPIPLPGAAPNHWMLPSPWRELLSSQADAPIIWGNRKQDEAHKSSTGPNIGLKPAADLFSFYFSLPLVAIYFQHLPSPCPRSQSWNACPDSFFWLFNERAPGIFKSVEIISELFLICTAQ